MSAASTNTYKISFKIESADQLVKIFTNLAKETSKAAKDIDSIKKSLEDVKGMGVSLGQVTRAMKDISKYAGQMSTAFSKTEKSASAIAQALSSISAGTGSVKSALSGVASGNVQVTMRKGSSATTSGGGGEMPWGVQAPEGHPITSQMRAVGRLLGLAKGAISNGDNQLFEQLRDRFFKKLRSPFEASGGELTPESYEMLMISGLGVSPAGANAKTSNANIKDFQARNVLKGKQLLSDITAGKKAGFPESYLSTLFHQWVRKVGPAYHAAGGTLEGSDVFADSSAQIYVVHKDYQAQEAARLNALKAIKVPPVIGPPIPPSTSRTPGIIDRIIGHSRLRLGRIYPRIEELGDLGGSVLGDARMSKITSGAGNMFSKLGLGSLVTGGAEGTGAAAAAGGPIGLIIAAAVVLIPLIKNAFKSIGNMFKTMMKLVDESVQYMKSLASATIGLGTTTGGAANTLGIGMMTGNNAVSDAKSISAAMTSNPQIMAFLKTNPNFAGAFGDINESKRFRSVLGEFLNTSNDNANRMAYLLPQLSNYAIYRDLSASDKKDLLDTQAPTDKVYSREAAQASIQSGKTTVLLTRLAMDVGKVILPIKTALSKFFNTVLELAIKAGEFLGRPLGLLSRAAGESVNMLSAPFKLIQNGFNWKKTMDSMVDNTKAIQDSTKATQANTEQLLRAQAYTTQYFGGNVIGSSLPASWGAINLEQQNQRRLIHMGSLGF